MELTKKYGADSQYRTLHLWVEKQLGKPQRCVECGTVTAKRYHWANISGEYKQEISDWKRLCVPCHAKLDGWGIGNKGPIVQPYCQNGHPRTEDNIYYSPTAGKLCRACKKISYAQYDTKTRKLGPTDYRRDIPGADSYGRAWCWCCNKRRKVNAWEQPTGRVLCEECSDIVYGVVAHPNPTEGDQK